MNESEQHKMPDVAEKTTPDVAGEAEKMNLVKLVWDSSRKVAWVVIGGSSFQIAHPDLLIEDEVKRLNEIYDKVYGRITAARDTALSAQAELEKKVESERSDYKKIRSHWMARFTLLMEAWRKAQDNHEMAGAAKQFIDASYPEYEAYTAEIKGIRDSLSAAEQARDALNLRVEELTGALPKTAALEIVIEMVKAERDSPQRWRERFHWDTVIARLTEIREAALSAISKAGGAGQVGR